MGEFLDLFAGIGGFRMGLEQAGHKAVGYIEWDKFARKSYEAIYNTEGEFTHDDITTVDYRRLPKSDLWVFGFPCQDISVAGKQQGFKGNRSSLFFRVTYLLRQTKEWDSNRLPSYLLIENVKNFLSINNGWDFFAAQVELDEIGYDVEWQLLNSKDFGVPQNRERIFIVGHLRGRSTRKVFPITGANTENTLKKIAGHNQGTMIYESDGLARTLMSEGGGWGAKTGLYAIPELKIKSATKKGYEEAKIGDSVNLAFPDSETRRGRVGDQVAQTLDTHCNQGVVIPIIDVVRGNKTQNGRRFKNPGEPMFTLTAQDRHGVMIPAKLDKMPYGKLCSMHEAGITDIGTELASTVTARYHKGIGGHKDNLVLKGIDDTYRIRRLTPRETWRLQGFPDSAFDKAAKVNSDSQLYKQAGNAVTVNVAYEIGKRLL